jgi:hypothetical protein
MPQQEVIVLFRKIVAAASRFVEYPTLLSALALGWWISMHGRLLLILLMCLLFAPTSSLPQNHALPPPVGGITFEQVIRLSQSGLSDDVIIAQIKKRPQPFDLSTDQLIQLKTAKVSDRIIQTMMVPSSSAATASTIEAASATERQPPSTESASPASPASTLSTRNAESSVARNDAQRQLPASWQFVKNDDPLHNKISDVLVLDGKYVTPPRTVAHGFVPSIVVECSNGKVERNYIVVGTVITLKGRGQPIFADLLDSRVDGKKGAIAATGAATDGTGVFFTRVDLKTILKAREVMVGVYEYLGSQVVMQFDMPDPAPVYAACGRDRILKKK